MKRTAIHMSLLAIAVASTLLSGCASVSQTRATASAIRAKAVTNLNPPPSRPVVAVHQGAWLMGAVVRPTKAPPPAAAARSSCRASHRPRFSRWCRSSPARRWY